MNKHYLKTILYVLSVQLFLSVLLSSVVHAQDYFVAAGQGVKIKDSIFVVSELANGKVIATINGKSQILEVGNPYSVDQLKFLVVDVSFYDPNDVTETVHLIVCTDEQEICNGVDDDCNGMIDDGLNKACGLGVGICAKGDQQCINGEWGYCDSIIPQTEICNGLDDDCDGKIDNGIEPRNCGLGVGVCAHSQQVCKDGVWTTCDAVTPTREICNGLDDDCDGVIDNSNSIECGSDVMKVRTDTIKTQKPKTETPKKATQKETATTEDKHNTDSTITGNVVKNTDSNENNKDSDVAKTSINTSETGKNFLQRFWEWLLRYL